MSDVPDTRVRLSAEGLEEVLTAFRRIRDEAEATSKSTGKDWQVFNAALEKGAALAETFGLALTAAGLIEFIKHGAEAASTVSDLSSETGLATSQLQALFALAQKSGVGVDSLTRDLEHLQINLDKLSSGDVSTKGLFERIGLSEKDLKGKDVGQALDLVATHMARLEAGATKTRIASDLFGKSGARLIPTLQELAGSGGLDGITRAAIASGQALSGDVIAGAAKVNNEIKQMQSIAGNLAITLASEVGPALVEAFTTGGQEALDLQKEIVDLGPTIQLVVGVIVRAIDLALLAVGQLVDVSLTTINVVVTAVSGAIDAGLDLVKGKAADAAFVWSQTLDKIRKDLDSQGARGDARGKAFLDLVSGRTAAQFQGPPAPPVGTGAAPPDPAKLAQDRLALKRALADNELKLDQQIVKAQEDLDRRRFDEGLLSLQDYYSRRRFLIESAAQAEITTLENRIAAEKGNPDDAQRRLNTANLEAQLAQKRLQLQTDLASSFRDEQQEREKLADQQKKFDRDALEAQGRRHEAVLQDIDAEAVARAKLAAQEGKSDDQVLAEINRQTEILRAAEEVRHQGELLATEMTRLDTARAAIQARIDAGTLGELEGKRLIAALDASRVPDLERIAQLQLAAAHDTGDAGKIAQAEQQLQQIQQMGVVASESQRLISNFGQAAGEVLGNELTSTLANAATKFTSLGQAALETFASIMAGLDQLAARIIASKLLELLHLVPGAAGAGAAAGGSDFASAGSFAGGGLFRGRGTGTSDSNLVRVSDREYWVRAAAVALPGRLSMLHAINRGGSIGQIFAAAMPHIATQVDPAGVRASALREIRGYADGGLTQVAAAAPASAEISGHATIEVNSSDDHIIRVMQSARGRRTTLNVVSRSPRAYRRAMRIP